MSDAHNYGRYTHGCRCDECKAAKREYQRQRRVTARMLAARLTQPQKGGGGDRVGLERRFVPGVKHGSAATYIEVGCRCWDCTDAASAKRLAEQHRRNSRRYLAPTSP